jgi:hypothetical protein
MAVTISTIQNFAITRVLISPSSGDWVNLPKKPSGWLPPVETVPLGKDGNGKRIYNMFWEMQFTFKIVKLSTFLNLTALPDALNQEILFNRPAMSQNPASPTQLSWVYSPALLADIIHWTSPEDMVGQAARNLTLSLSMVEEYIRGIPGMPF